MISVVCVYNNRAALERILLPSLKEQSATCERILMDNTQGQWKSAASALNWGASRATGTYVMFLHQDVELGNPEWLRITEQTLNELYPFGIAGSIGMSPEGHDYNSRLRGYICNAGQQWGKPISRPESVQTLDECLLIVPRRDFEGFDEKTFDHWHCYGCDYALRMNENGRGAYVIPGYIYHRSRATNTDRLRKYHLRLFFKHRRQAPIYATSSGITWVNVLALPMIPPLVRLNRLLFPNWIETAKKELAGCTSLLDLGCGYNSPIQFFDSIRESTGVEIHKPYLIESRKKAIHTSYIEGDVRLLDFLPNSYDAVFCSEVLEHLAREEGQILLDKMERYASKKIIVTTPNGPVHQSAYDDNPYQAHRSSWRTSDFRERGYRVMGMSGWKGIRGEQGTLKMKPEFLGHRVASLSYRLTKYMPELDFQLLAIKEIRS